MLNSIILLGGLVSAFGLGAISPNQEKQDNVQFRLENHKSVQYDDTTNTVVLSSSDITYSFIHNLSLNLVDDYPNYSNGLVVNDSTFKFGDSTYSIIKIHAEYFYESYTINNGEPYWHEFAWVYFDISSTAGLQIGYAISAVNDVVNYGSGLHVDLFDSSGDGERIRPKRAITELSYISVSNDVFYNAVQSAFELNISPILGDIVSLLVGGITSFASGLGAGVSALVGDIFINNGSLSVFGYMVVIFAGIALAIGLSRWVMNFLTSLGRKK